MFIRHCDQSAEILILIFHMFQGKDSVYLKDAKTLYEETYSKEGIKVFD